MEERDWPYAQEVERNWVRGGFVSATKTYPVYVMVTKVKKCVLPKRLSVPLRRPVYELVVGYGVEQIVISTGTCGVQPI